MPDASPTKWHLAHTSWFFETFVLDREPGCAQLRSSVRLPVQLLLRGGRPAARAAPAGAAHAAGSAERWCAIAPTSTQRCAACLPELSTPKRRRWWSLDSAHEEQHQELILTDVLHLFAQNPAGSSLSGARPSLARPRRTAAVSSSIEGGLVEIGADGEGAFSFDNERPRHQVYLRPYRLAERLVTNGEWLAFIEDGGYRRPELWLSDGWSQVQAGDWIAPLYWRLRDGVWWSFGLHGLEPLDDRSPGSACQLLRGGRIRALVRRPASDRGRVGARRAHSPRSAQAAVRRGVAVDVERLRRLSGLSARRRRSRRVQRQVHGQPDGAAWRILRHSGRTHPPRLSQLLSNGQPAGSSRA